MHDVIFAMYGVGGGGGGMVLTFLGGKTSDKFFWIYMHAPSSSIPVLTLSSARHST